MRPVVFAAAVALFTACGDDGGGSASWPDRLYLALRDSELTVQLVEQEPEPF
jgi:hypothetical protein